MRLIPTLLILLLLLFSFIQHPPALITNAAEEQPDSSRFTVSTLVQGLDEPMAMGILPNDNLLSIS